MLYLASIRAACIAAMDASKLLCNHPGLFKSQVLLGQTTGSQQAPSGFKNLSSCLVGGAIDRKGNAACLLPRKQISLWPFVSLASVGLLDRNSFVEVAKQRRPAIGECGLFEARRRVHNVVREGVIASQQPLKAPKVRTLRKPGSAVQDRPQNATETTPVRRKVRTEKGFTSSEDGPSTSGRDDTTEGSKRTAYGATSSGVKTPRTPKPPRNPDRNAKPSRPPSAERSAVYEMLEGRGKAPKKSLGQNFVIDADVIKRVVTSAGIEPGDVVLEIGPGTGNLTRALVEAGGNVVAVEKDGQLAEMLAASWEGSDQVEVEEADILRWAVEDRIAPLLPAGKRAKCVANLPYNITTSTLKKILPLGGLFSDCTLMLQEEAAERLVNAAPGDSEYRAMSFFVNFYAEPRISFRVDKSAFTPQPKCDSAVVVMSMRRPGEWPEVTSPRAFFSLVNVAFGGRRKMLRNSLQASQHDPADISDALQEIGLDVKSRPESLSLTDFLALFRKLEGLRIASKKKAGGGLQE